MKAIIVDDEPLMIRSFLRSSKEIPDLEVVSAFTHPDEALNYVRENPVELAFLDIRLPEYSGIELAGQLQEIRPGILIVLISAYEEYLRDANRIGADYYIVKPYRKETLEMVMEKLRLIIARQRRRIFVRTFGRFTVLLEGKPVRLTGKAKEILALIVTKRGKEISNEQIYLTVWENRAYSNDNMTVYYNALRRLKNALNEAGIPGLLISTPRGQMVDVTLFDCDYYDWLDGRESAENNFEGEFLSEYSWGEYILSGMLEDKIYG